MECTPARKTRGWTACRKCGERVHSIALNGDSHCPHCASDTLRGWRTCRMQEPPACAGVPRHWWAYK
eukprot:7220772-Prorocentrum_lima.AAC.1